MRDNGAGMKYEKAAECLEVQAFPEIFALYLSDYKNVSISIEGTRIDPSRLIASQGSVNLSDVVDEGKPYPRGGTLLNGGRRRTARCTCAMKRASR
ncbi:MAG: hypothetical protein ABI612_08230 [Betaproteobacteria bacterium]